MGDSAPLYDDLVFPGHGMSHRQIDENAPLSPFGRLSRGQGLGKKSVLVYDTAVYGGQQAIAQPSPVDILEVNGIDYDADQLQVTLGTPLAIPRRLADVDGENIQNQTGEFTASQIGDADYPGTVDPIAWPPFVALIHWGVGGARSFAAVDFVGGATVNLGPASFVRVHAAVPPDGINCQGTTGMYVLSAFIGPGRPRSGIAQRTVYVGSIMAAADSAVFVVPPFAKRATVIGLDVAAPNVTVAYLSFFRSPNATNPVGTYIVNGNQPLPFNVPNAGQYFTVNNGMGGTQAFAVIFELAL